VEFFLTQDPSLIIIYEKDNIVIYFNTWSDESWLIYGECNFCGACIQGAVSPDLRKRYERLDIPVRPEISTKTKECVLRGEYL
jgi:hypothetical protein